MQAQEKQSGYDSQQDSTVNNVDALGVEIRGMFNDIAAERRLWEQKWLKNLRQYKGIYEDATQKVLAKQERSEAYIRITRAKVKTMDSRTSDMLFPAGDEQNWQIEPTPEPELSHEKIEQIKEIVRQNTGGQEEPTEDEVEIIVKDVAKQSAERMALKMSDQLIEMKFGETARSVLHNGHLFGTGILKGPMAEKKPERRWKDKSGAFELDTEEVMSPLAESVSIFDIYADMSVSDVKDCEFFIQRHVMPRHRLRRLARRRGFSKKKINEYIQTHPNGDSQYLEWEVDFKNLNEENASIRVRKNKYEVLEYWGIMDGERLSQCGCEAITEEMMNQDFEAVIWVVGNVAIKAILNPTEQQQRPYHFYYMEKDDTSIYGEGVPDLMEDTDELFNSAIRAALDNAAITAGPQLEVNMDLLHDSEDPRLVHPFRVWLRGGIGAEAQNRAVHSIDVESHVQELVKLAQYFRDLGDETSTIPSYMAGENPTNGAADTVGGLSMLMGASNITIKDTIKNYDMVTKSFISALYHWNMQFSKDERIKGDSDVKAVGSTSLVAREVQSHALTNFASTTANPIDEPWIKRGNLNKQRQKAMGLSDLVRSEDEHEELMRQRSPQPGMSGQPGGDAEATGGTVSA
jgi:hypothetical protein